MIPLHIAHLTKRYGNRLAVDDLSLDVSRGTVFGLLGRNGAGKSSTIACVLGLIAKTSGEIALFGEPLQPRTFDRIAYVPEINCLDGWMTTHQHVEFRRRCFSRFDRTLMSELIERFEIEPGRKVGKLSKGQRQAVALALAFAQRPELMILDEPASGLDPVMQRRLLDTIVSAAADGVTVLFSSHQIGHAEQAAERIGIIDSGRLALEADVDDLRAKRFLVEAVFEDGRIEQHYANGDVTIVEAQLRARSPVTVTRRTMNLEQIFLTTISETKERQA
ncbi:MAG TPA: ABC transporter ATP-binding protein [Verrucomicrobiae bacterium]|nr:ABC transporter ATP-binding protein [Verrucomicrobiae bacterium]HTZ56129.1 ABC transporter ATP-binding protein [Candidatus Acidoferrum sp.]